jgi:UDP-2,3-diacylglucosamine pyrophosphatase LpxH
MRQFDAVVVSDLHLGALNSRREDLLRFLDWLDTPHLILNGDIFDHPRLRRLGPADLEVIGRLRQRSEWSRVTWLRGNHDPSENWFRDLLGLAPCDELLLPVGGRPYLVCHGHVWDRSLDLPDWIITAAEAIYRLAQGVDGSHHLARRLKHGSRKFQRAIESMTSRAVETGRSRELAGIVWGHCHVAADQHLSGLHLLNTGCWTETPSAFVGIRDGVARTFFWDTSAPRRLRPDPRRPRPAGQLSRRWSSRQVPARPR